MLSRIIKGRLTVGARPFASSNLTSTLPYYGLSARVAAATHYMLPLERRAILHLTLPAVFESRFVKALAVSMPPHKPIEPTRQDHYYDLGLGKHAATSETRKAYDKMSAR